MKIVEDANRMRAMRVDNIAVNAERVLFREMELEKRVEIAKADVAFKNAEEAARYFLQLKFTTVVIFFKIHLKYYVDHLKGWIDWRSCASDVPL